MLQLSIVMPGALDGNAQSMAKRLPEQFQQKESKSATQFSGGAEAEDDKNDTQDAVQNGKLNEFEAGDVSSSISDFDSMTVHEKKSLVSKLNKDIVDA